MEYAPGALDCWMALASDQKCEMKAFLFIKAASSIRLSVCLKLLQIYMLACPDCVRGAHCSVLSTLLSTIGLERKNLSIRRSRKKTSSFVPGEFGADSGTEAQISRCQLLAWVGLDFFVY